MDHLPFGQTPLAWLEFPAAFQAPGLYGKLGYQAFGELDYPPEHMRFLP
jgi:hypothetical protein